MKKLEIDSNTFREKIDMFDHFNNEVKRWYNNIRATVEDLQLNFNSLKKSKGSFEVVPASVVRKKETDTFNKALQVLFSI
jgi:hypothetical protein